MRLIALAGFFLLLLARPGLAFNVQENWVGNQVRWEDEDLPIEWRLDSGNTPGGSARRIAVDQALDAWNRTGGLRLLFTTSGGGAETDNVMEEGDGKSEILYTPMNEIDGAAGREFTTHNCAGCRRIVESDIGIASDAVNVVLNNNPATDQFFRCTAQGVLVHELGHAIGLGHESTRMSIMQPICQDSPRVRSAEPGYMVLPDDQQGARQQYGGNGDEVNLIAISQYLFRELPVIYRDRYTTLEQAGIINPNANNQRLVNYGQAGTRRAFNPDILECAAFAGFDPTCAGSFYDVMGTEPRAQNLCPGDSFDVPFTVANRANSAATSKEHSIGFYLTEDTDAPFDPTSQFLATPPLAGAILDNEIEFDSTGSLNATGMQRLTLSSDPDCAPAGEYRLWHGVDICHEHLEGNGTVAAGGILEDDNFALTGLFINILDPGAPQCSALALPASDGICGLAEIRKTCEAPPVEPPDQPPTECPPGGCGTEESGLCLTVGEDQDGDQIGGDSTADRVLFQGSHPDGDQSASLYCLDDVDITGFDELVCSGANETCVACDEEFAPGCTCDPDFPDSCGTGSLTCIATTGYGNNQSFSSGRCWPADEGVPSWECQADCSLLYGQNGYCHHGALPWEGAGFPICADASCDVGGVDCAEQGLACNVDTGDCEPECTDSAQCQARGYPDSYQCDNDTQRCFITGVPHP